MAYRGPIKRLSIEERRGDWVNGEWDDDATSWVIGPDDIGVTRGTKREALRAVVEDLPGPGFQLAPDATITIVDVNGRVISRRRRDEVTATRGG